MALRACPALTVPAWTAGVPPSCPGSRTPFQPPRAVSPCPRDAPAPQHVALPGHIPSCTREVPDGQCWGCPRCPWPRLSCSWAWDSLRVGSNTELWLISARYFVWILNTSAV